jgi:hypothetical protein
MQGQGDDQLSANPSDAAVVFLDVYSGRPNPSWPLEGGTLQAVRDRVRETEGLSAESTPPPPVLGYRGFRIENLGADAPDTVFVGRGTVTVVRGKRVEHRPDTTDLEGLLLVEASNREYADLLKAAGAPSPRRTA